MRLRRNTIRSAVTYVVVVIFSMIPPSSLERCTVHDYDINSCIITAVCQEYVEHFEFPSDFREKCYNNYVGYSALVAMKYRKAYNYNNFEEIPAIQHSYSNLIFSFDISNNEYTSFPVLREMTNLKYLNVSYNFITTAVLSSRHQFSHLEEIDVSHNSINKLEVNENEYTFCSVIKLNLSHNRLVDIDNGFFNNFNALKYFDVSYNEISYVPVLALSGLNNDLEYLNLANNKIDEVNGALSRFSNLQYLLLNNNKITHLSLNDFKNMNSLQTLDCSSNLISIIDTDVFSQMFKLKTINLEYNLINNLDKLMFVNTSLTSIDLSRNEIEMIPKFIFKNKNLTDFKIEANNLQGEITRGTFAGLSYVSELNLSHQSINTLKDNAFFGLDNLKELYLNNNNIQNISMKAFGFLKYLKRLDLSNNQIINLNFETKDLVNLDFFTVSKNKIKIIRRDDLDGLEVLQFLDVSYNNITKIEPHSFSFFSEISFFNISENPLTDELESNTFDGLNSLPNLDLSRTKLTKIRNETFNHMFNLRTLNISRSGVNEIYYNAFLNTNNIEVLDLSYNLLKYFYVNSTQLTNLRDLHLNHNLIAVIPSGIFSKMKKLVSINLSYNNIDKMNEESFNNCRNVVSLDVSSNRNLNIDLSLIDNLINLERLSISNISKHVTFSKTNKLSITELYMSAIHITNASSLGINYVPTINVLYLSKNKIETIESDIFSNLSRLHHLDLSLNDIKFIQAGAFKHNINLNLLNISHNHLITLSYGVLYGLMHLDTLDLSFNEIQDLQSERLYDIPTLRVLIIDHNNIRKVTFEDLSDHNLEILSLGGNPIPCEMIRKLKKRFKELLVTAVNPSRAIINTDGIICSDHSETGLLNNGSLIESINVLNDIRNLLFNINNKTANVIEDRMKDLVDGNDKTNFLLERYLRLGSSITNATVQASWIKSNESSDTVITPHNISNTMQVAGISLPIKDDDVTTTLNNTIVALIKKALNDAKEEQKSPLFLEICTGLVLLILLSLVMYKVYKYVILKPRHSLSMSQQIVVPMDDSHRL